MVSPQPLWEPSTEQVRRANLTRFMREVGAADYASLYAWSVQRRDEFWPAVWRFCGIIADERRGTDPWDQVVVGGDRVAPPDPSLGPRWFTGSRLNFAENLLRRGDAGPAVIFWNE